MQVVGNNSNAREGITTFTIGVFVV